jgi:hypothetical protein
MLKVSCDACVPSGEVNRGFCKGHLTFEFCESDAIIEFQSASADGLQVLVGKAFRHDFAGGERGMFPWARCVSNVPAIRVHQDLNVPYVARHSPFRLVEQATRSKTGFFSQLERGNVCRQDSQDHLASFSCCSQIFAHEVDGP